MLCGEPHGVSDGSRPVTVEILACDWNGTLVDDVPRAWRATREVLLRQGLPAPDPTVFVDAFELPLSGFFEKLGVEGRGLKGAEADWNTYMGSEKAAPMPNVAGMLDRLHELGIAVRVLSAADPAILHKDIQALGLEGRFAFVEGFCAPKRQALGRLAETYSAQRVAYLGDTERDVKEALVAGALAIGFGGGYRQKEALRAVGAQSIATDLRDVQVS